MRIRFSKLAILAGALVMSGVGMADDTRAFYGGKEDGWFWYKDPPVIIPPEPPKQDPKQEVLPKGPAPFSVTWLRENMDRLRDDAIENPEDKEKVRAYLYAVRVMMDKAQNFADSAHDIANTDPLLDNNNRIPLGSASKTAALQLQKDARREIMGYLSKRAGVWFFYDGKCGYCRSQIPLLNTFKTMNPGFRVRNVSMDGSTLPGLTGETVRDQGQAKRLGLKITPTMVMVAPPNTYAIVSQGLITSSDLEDKILMSARMANVIPEELLKKYQIYNKGVLTSDDLKTDSGERVDMTDPAQWVKFLQEKLQGRY